MPTKKNKYMKPSEAKQAGAKLKAVLLTEQTINALQKQADNVGFDLKKYMERCLIQISNDKTFKITL